jgi:hypothetical protein
MEVIEGIRTIKNIKKKDQTGIEPVTLGPAIPRSTPELLILYVIFPPHFLYINNYAL